jgi:hypothetical protein
MIPLPIMDRRLHPTPVNVVEERRKLMLSIQQTFTTRKIFEKKAI